jgi:hypothetical protein
MNDNLWPRPYIEIAEDLAREGARIALARQALSLMRPTPILHPIMRHAKGAIPTKGTAPTSTLHRRDESPEENK